MFIIKENWMLATELSETLLNYVKENNFHLSEVCREYKYTEDGTADCTDAEILATNEKIRQWLFQKQSDPLFFKVQRGELGLDEWTAKVNQIRTDWPTR